MTLPLHTRAAATIALAAAVFGCATANPTGGQASPEPAQQAQDARLLSDAVLVLPVHDATLDAGGATLPMDTVNALRSLFDEELKRMLQPRVSGSWMWADDVRALHRRNPLNVPDPARLATHSLRGSRVAAEQILAADLGSQLRALLAVAGARRYAILPLRLHVGPASHGGHAGGVTLLVIDTRRSMIAQVRPVVLRSGAGETVATTLPLAQVVRRLADMARLELTGPDPQ